MKCPCFMFRNVCVIPCRPAYCSDVYNVTLCLALTNFVISSSKSSRGLVRVGSGASDLIIAAERKIRKCTLAWLWYQHHVSLERSCNIFGYIENQDAQCCTFRFSPEIESLVLAIKSICSLSIEKLWSWMLNQSKLISFLFLSFYERLKKTK